MAEVELVKVTKQMSRIPKEFFKTINGITYSKTPPGNLDMERFLAGLAAFAQPEENKVVPKHLIFSDWRAGGWSEEKKTFYQQQIAFLLEAGFCISIWQDGEFLSVDAATLPDIFTKDALKRITPSDAKTIHAQANHLLNLALDDQYLLEERHLLQLGNETDEDASKILELDDCILSPHNLYELCNLIISTPPETIRVRTYSTLGCKLLKYLNKHLPDVAVELQLEKFVVESLDTPKDFFFPGAPISEEEFFQHASTIRVIDIRSRRKLEPLRPYWEKIMQESAGLHYLNLGAFSDWQDERFQNLLAKHCNLITSLNLEYVSTRYMMRIMKFNFNLLKSLKQLHIRSMNPGDCELWFQTSERKLVLDITTHQLLPIFIMQEVHRILPNATINGLKRHMQEGENPGFSKFCIWIRNFIVSPGSPEFNSLSILEHVELCPDKECNPKISGDDLWNFLNATPKLRHLTLNSDITFSNPVKVIPKPLKNLETLYVEAAMAPEFFQTLVNHAPNLKNIFIEHEDDAKFHDLKFQNLRLPKKLKQLKIRNPVNKTLLIRILEQCQQLEVFHLLLKIRNSEADISIKLPEDLPWPSSLRDLNMHAGYYHQDALIKILSQVPKLRSLSLDELPLHPLALQKDVIPRGLTHFNQPLLWLKYPEIFPFWTPPRIRKQRLNPDDISEPLTPYNPEQHRFSKPPLKNSFQFTGQHNNLSQLMVIEKFCQYLTLIKKNPAYICHIQDGICRLLTIFYQKNADFSQSLMRIYQWDGLYESLSPELANDFDSLLKIQSNPDIYCIGRFCIGDAIKEVLTRIGENQSITFSNSWHSIIVKRIAADVWEYYEPNYAKGPLCCSGDALPKMVQQSLGDYVSIDSTDVPLERLPPLTIADPDLFIAQGGLKTLYRSENFDALLQTLANHSFSRQALKGILLRDVKDAMPFWRLSQLHPDSRVRAFGKRLMEQYKAQFPRSWRADFCESNADYKPYINPFLKANANTTDTDSNPDCSDLKSDSDKAKIQNTQDINPLAQEIARIGKFKYRLEKKAAAQAKPINLQQYARRQIKPATSLLIELHSSKDADAMAALLYAQASKNNRPVYLINNSAQLRCLGQYLRRNTSNNTGTQEQGPHGDFYRFLERHAESWPLLIIDYSAFTASQLVATNGILNTPPLLDGTPLPGKVQIIGLFPKSHSYRGADFFTRFNRQDAPAYERQALRSHLPVERICSAPIPVPCRSHTNEDNTKMEQTESVMKLYQSNDWRSRLLGSWHIQGKSFHFTPGPLLTALKRGISEITLANAPWHDEQFQQFWTKTLLAGSIDIADENVPLPPNFRLHQYQGYDWRSLMEHCAPAASKQLQGNSLLLNPSTFNAFFNGYKLHGDALRTQVGGIIARKAGKTLSVVLSRNLSKHQWAQLLEHCQKHHVRLLLHKAPGVDLPEPLQPLNIPEVYTPHPSGCLTVSSDVDFSLRQYLQAHPDVCPVNISGCSAFQLFGGLHGQMHGQKMDFSIVPGLLDTNFSDKIILYGALRPEVADALNQLFLRNPKLAEKIHVLSNNAASCQILQPMTATVTTAMKRAQLPPEERSLLAPFLEEPWCQIQARLRYLRSIGSNVPADSEDAWKGMSALSTTAHPQQPFSIDTADAEADSFLKQRIQQIQNRLRQGPFVVLYGLTGVGKTTSVMRDLAGAPGVRVCLDREEWLKKLTADETQKVLFIDEANMAGDLSWLEGLMHHSPSVVVDEQFYPLTKQHKVIFAANPVTYGNNRQKVPLFRRHGSALVLEPLSAAVIYSQVLKPVLASRITDSETLQAVAKEKLKVYEFLCRHAKNRILISPRELRTMAQLSVHYLQTHPDANPIAVSRYYAALIGKALVPEAHTAAFERQFPLQCPEQEPAPCLGRNYIVTPSRMLITRLLIDFIRLKQAADSDAMRCEGLGGIILEGAPGEGKTAMLPAVLEAEGYTRVCEEATETDKQYLLLSASTDPHEIEHLLDKAYKNGWVVVCDEINSIRLPERLLNCYLMGHHPEGLKPKRTGFLLIGTQNPAGTMAGRKMLSHALARRVLTLQVPAYSPEEVEPILSAMGLFPDTVQQLIIAWKGAKVDGNPVSFRSLLHLAQQTRNEQRRLHDETPSQWGLFNKQKSPTWGDRSRQNSPESAIAQRPTAQAATSVNVDDTLLHSLTQKFRA